MKIDQSKTQFISVGDIELERVRVDFNNVDESIVENYNEEEIKKK